MSTSFFARRCLLKKLFLTTVLIFFLSIPVLHSSLPSIKSHSSIVGFDECRKMGEVATAGVMSNFKNTIKGMKRLVGLAFDDPRAVLEMKNTPGVAFVPMKHSSGGPDSIAVQVSLANETVTIPIEAVCGMMIKHIGEIAARKAAAESNMKNIDDINKLMPQDWVIAIPNYFTDAQRRAVLSGCQIVGIQGVQRLMHENTATALAYGIFKDLKKEFVQDTPTNCMFIDMGASAYTVSIVTFTPGKLVVKSAYCNPDLGGRDFDLVIAEWISKNFEEKFKGKLSGKPLDVPKARLKLLVAAEQAKKTLSPVGVKEARINIEMLLDELDFNISLKSDEYEKLCQPLLDKLTAPINAALLEAKISIDQLNAVEIVGGSTRIGCLKRKLLEIFNNKVVLSTTMNADESVARGAALQSAILSPRFKVLPYDIEEAQPYPIHISWGDGTRSSGMEVDSASGVTPTDQVTMFDRGLSFPIVRRVTLRRSDAFVVRSSYDDNAVQYGLDATARKEIADFTIKLPPGDERKVRVNVKEDIHGIIHLSSAQMVEEYEEEGAVEEKAADTTDGEDAKTDDKKKKIKKTNLEFSTIRPLEWTAAEINKFFENEVSMSNTDRLVKETSNMRNELESYIYDMRDKIMSDAHLGPYGTDTEKSAFVAKNEAMENWLYEEGFDATKTVYAEKLSELKALGGPLEKRQAEAQGRAAGVASLKAALEVYQSWLNGEGQTAEHITDEEREKVRAATDSASAWMYEMLDKQGSRQLSEDPVLTVSSLNSKVMELNSTCGPIKRKPVPIKKKEETPPPPTATPTPSDGSAEKPAEGKPDEATPMEE
jgi:heat shock 70kDa protein 4